MDWQALQELLIRYVPVLTLSGIIMALASMVAIPWLVVRMPQDYFVNDTRPPPDRGALAWIIWGARNLLALVLILAGILMLVLPGQGLLTIMIGVACSTFPGKFYLQRRLAAQPGVLTALNWIRQKYRRTPLLAPRP